MKSQQYPEVRFVLDQKFDRDIAHSFLNERIGKYDFGYDRIIKLHPQFSVWRKLPPTKRRQLIKTASAALYEQNVQPITQALSVMQKIWDKISRDYFQEMEKIFGSLTFYKPRIIEAKLSIFQCGVIDKNLAAFQIWYGVSHDAAEVRRHVAHELTHFFYYTYLRTHGYSKLTQDWDLAEIFNRIVLNQPSLLHLTKKKDMGYSFHTRKVPRYRKIWEESTGVEQFLQTLTRSKRR